MKHKFTKHEWVRTTDENRDLYPDNHHLLGWVVQYKKDHGVKKPKRGGYTYVSIKWIKQAEPVWVNESILQPV